MSLRIEELLAKLGDDGLTTAEADEAEAQLEAADPETRRGAEDFLRLEAGLRRCRRNPEVSDQVMAALAARQSVVVNRVMQDVSQRAPRAQATWRMRTSPPRRKIRTGVVAGFLALFAGLAFALVSSRQRREPLVPRPVVSAEPGIPPATPPRFLPTTGEASPTTVRPPPEPIELFSMDFEDGVTPPFLKFAAIVPGPPRPGNGFVAVGGLSKFEPRENLFEFRFDESGRNLRFSDRIVVIFDVWAGGDSNRLVVQTYDSSRRKNFAFAFPKISGGRWQHVSVRFTDLIANDSSGFVPVMGDDLMNLIIVGGLLPGGGLFVDNLRIVEFPVQAQLPATQIIDTN